MVFGLLADLSKTGNSVSIKIFTDHDCQPVAQKGIEKRNDLN